MGVSDDDLLKQKGPAAEIQTFIERLLLRRLGAEVPGAEKESSAPRTNREFSTLESRTAWPRRINGSDALGFIQFFTLVAFWTMVVAATAKSMVAMRQYEFLADPDVFPQHGRRVDRRLINTQVRKLERMMHIYRRPGGRSSCIPLEIAYAGYAAMKASSFDYKAVPAFVETRMNTFLEQSSTGFSMIRYLVWVIPSIGFIGTVIGIGNALLGTGQVLASDVLEQQAAIQSIASRLGTAFDTTFLALILSIIATLLLHVVQKQEEDLIQRSAEKTMSSLIDPSQLPTVEQEAPADIAAPVAASARQQPVKGTVQPASLYFGEAVAFDRAAPRYWLDALVVFALASAVIFCASWIRVDDRPSRLGQRVWNIVLGSHTSGEDESLLQGDSNP